MPSPAHFSSTQVVKRKPKKVVEGGCERGGSAEITPSALKQKRHQIMMFLKRLRGIKPALRKANMPQSDRQPRKPVAGSKSP